MVLFAISVASLAFILVRTLGADNLASNPKENQGSGNPEPDFLVDRLVVCIVTHMYMLLRLKDLPLAGHVVDDSNWPEEENPQNENRCAALWLRRATDFNAVVHHVIDHLGLVLHPALGAELSLGLDNGSTRTAEDFICALGSPVVIFVAMLMCSFHVFFC